MAVILEGLKATDKITPRAKWRVTLVADASEVFLFASFPAMLDRWLDGLNGLAYPASVVTYQKPGPLVAVVDIRIIPLAVDYGTVADVVNVLDTMIKGIDVREIQLVSDTESNAIGDAKREAIRASTPAPPTTGLGAAVDDAIEAGQETGREFLDKLADILKITRGVLVAGIILGAGALVVYGLSKAKAVAS